ncbi:hypothetical protein ZWY2020_044475 [Hordeum vulgare]|nr:hypothetical protein ZWY2020_044475 [Hordeum vulgare]
MADAASSPAMLPPSDSDLLLPPTNVPTPEAAARTPNLPDTPASAADPETPFSDAATASDADVSTVAPLYVVAVDDGKEEGINDPSGAARKHMTLAPPAPPTKNSKKKGGNCVWTRPSSRKGKKKAKQPSHAVSGGVAPMRRPSPRVARTSSSSPGTTCADDGK